MFDRTKKRVVLWAGSRLASGTWLWMLGGMTGWRRWVLAFLGGWALAAGVAPGEELPREGGGGALSAGVQDHAGLFSRNPEALRRMSGKIAELEADHGFQLHVVLESVLISGTASVLAARLQEEWLPEGRGMVVVYEVDSRAVGVGKSGDGDAGGDLGAEGRVPSYEMAVLLAKVMEVTDAADPPEKHVETLVAALVKELDDYFDRWKAPASPGRSLRFGLVAAGTLSVLALAALGMAWVLRRTGSGGPRRFRFPEVDVPERLEAPAGGGDVTSRRFGPRGGPPAGG